MNIRNDTSRLLTQAFENHRLNKLPAAKRGYESILAVNPSHFDALQLLGLCLSQMGQNEAALEKLSRALSIRKDVASVFNHRGMVLSQLQRRQEAIADFDRALALRSNFAEALYNKGNALAELERYEEALESFDAAIVLKPDCAEFQNNRGNVLKHLGRIDDALSSYERAIKLKADYPEALVNRGAILTDREELVEALACLNDAIAIRGNYADAYLHRGNVLRAADHYKEALEDYRRALELNPRLFEAHLMLGKLLKEVNCHEDAISILGRLVDLYPEKPRAFIERASVFARVENWSAARDDLNRALELDQGNFDALRSLSLLPVDYLEPQRLTGLLSALEVKNHSDEASQLHVTANFLACLGNYEASFQSLCRFNDLRSSQLPESDPSWLSRQMEAEKEIAEWSPFPDAKPADDSGIQLLVILGPSRSGKTSLERMLCLDTSFFRGYEGTKANLVGSKLRELAAKQRGSDHGEGFSDKISDVLPVLYPEKDLFQIVQEQRVLTITNPFLLTYSHYLYDLSPRTKFIFLRRDRIDTGAEIYRKDYKSRLRFAYDPRLIMEHLNWYDRLSLMFIEKMGSRARVVDYKDVVNNEAWVLTSIYEFLEQPDGRRAAIGSIESSAHKMRSPSSPYREYFEKLLESK